MPTIALSMIVRNEVAVIARCLGSVRPHVTHWAIVDTGSTDKTRTIVRREMRGLPGQLTQRRWVDDFSVSRNQALHAARATGAQFVLFLDADEEIVWPTGGVLLKDARGLGRDGYAITTHVERPHSTESFNRVRLVRSGDAPSAVEHRIAAAA